MKKWRHVGIVLGFMVLSIGLGCSHSSVQWASQTVSSLECGISIEEVEQLYGKAVFSPGPEWLGNYRIDKGRIDMWLLVDQETGKVQAARWTLPRISLRDSKSSLRRYLCTGEVTTLVTMLGEHSARQSTVSLDGHHVGVIGDFGLRIETSPGTHELLIKKGDTVLLERTLDLSDRSIGEHFVSIPEFGAS